LGGAPRQPAFVTPKTIIKKIKKLKIKLVIFCGSAILFADERYV